MGGLTRLPLLLGRETFQLKLLQCCCLNRVCDNYSVESKVKLNNQYRLSALLHNGFDGVLSNSSICTYVLESEDTDI